MDDLNKQSFLSAVLRQGYIMNTVNGGILLTDFNIKYFSDAVQIEVSNPSISRESFNFIIDRDELLIYILSKEMAFARGPQMHYPLFFKTIQIPYFIDIKKIDVTYKNRIFSVRLPFSNKLPPSTFKLKVRNKR